MYNLGVFKFDLGNSANGMEGGYESGSGRMIHENEGGYGLELVGGARDGFASGSGIGSEGKGSIQNVILSHLDVKEAF